MIIQFGISFIYESPTFLNESETWTHRALFSNFLILGLTGEFCNPLDNWLESTSPTNHPADYKIRGLTQELKIW